MTTTTELKSPPAKSETIYDRVFWLSYFANFSLVMANALTFRFAEFVKYLGGTEQVTGTIVSTGLVITLLVRFRLGQDIDRFGTGRLWIASSALFVSGSLLLTLTTVLSWSIYLARITYSVGVAGMFTCTMVFIQNHVPPDRRTEAIGNLGTSGFLGMIAGSLLSDWILTAFVDGRIQFQVLFGSTAGLGVLCLATVVVLTRNDGFEEQHGTPPLHRLLFRYWPGPVVLAAMMIGISLSVTTVFLTRFATARGLGGIGPFFTVYALSAFCFRILARRWSHTVGRHRMILMGLTAHAVGHLTLIFVTNPWQFLFPAVACGFGHALLLPAVVSLGAGHFPRQYRGTGTSTMIGCSEFGIAIASPLLGWIIDHYRFTPMLCVTSGTALTIALIYALTAAHRSDYEGANEPHGAVEAVPEHAGDVKATEEADDAEVPFPQIGRIA